MKIHELKGQLTKSAKRVGRGIGSGYGKTAGRGTKGQGARSGGNRRPGFEGGQNPLMQRLPKQRGFKSRNSKAQIAHTDQLNQLSTATVTADVLLEAGLITNAKKPVKLLARGELKKKVNVTLNAASAAAITQLQKAGGSFNEDPAQQLKKPAKAKS